MRPKYLVLPLLGLLAGCAEPPPGYHYSFVSTVGTPVYVLFKIPVCIATAVIAAPSAALQGLAAPNEDPLLGSDIRPGLEAGVHENCGPPYILPPDNSNIQVVQQQVPGIPGPPPVVAPRTVAPPAVIVQPAPVAPAPVGQPLPLSR